MKLKIYVDRLSEPSRAILIFCKVNGIDFEEIKMDLAKGQHLSDHEFKNINPMKQVPAIVDGMFKLFESHAILKYLACKFPRVADHWYPSDLLKRAMMESVLDWHHSNLRRGSVGYISNGPLAPLLGVKLDTKAAAAEGEKLLSASLDIIESFWLRDGGRFLLGSSQPSIADISLVCELMQLEFVDDEDRIRILKPYTKVKKWMEDTKIASRPHFDEIHASLFEVKGNLQKRGILAAAKII